MKCHRHNMKLIFRYDEALKTADNIMTFKLAVKTIAKRHGMFASFMPKPKYGINGSGMHVNMSLAKDGKKFLPTRRGEMGLSKEAFWFIGGIMKHMKGMTVITNPLVNSYKRLVPGYEAPIYVAWSATNRSPLIRIPVTRGAGTRVELRCPDSGSQSISGFSSVSGGRTRRNPQSDHTTGCRDRKCI